MTCVKGSPRKRTGGATAVVTVGVGECYPAGRARECRGCPHIALLVHRSVDNQGPQRSPVLIRNTVVTSRCCAGKMGVRLRDTDPGATGCGPMMAPARPVFVQRRRSGHE